MKRLGLLGVMLAACLCGFCRGLRAQDTIRMTVFGRLVLDWHTVGNDETLIAEFEDGRRETIKGNTEYKFDEHIVLYSPTSFMSFKGDMGYVYDLDISNCFVLDSFECHYYLGSSLDLSKNTALTYLVCSGCYYLNSLDLSKNTALTYLDCSGCYYLNSLDLSKNTALTHLNCSSNKLQSLDVSSCRALDTLLCFGNELQSLDVSHKEALVYLDAHGNRTYNSGGNKPRGTLTSLDVRGCLALRFLDCGDAGMGGGLTSLDVSTCTALETLNCRNNDLTSLDVSGCTALERLDCGNNDLTSLDVSGCTALMNLSCYSNDLTLLDVSGCTALETLDCGGNGLTSLDVSGCTALKTLNCNSNKLQSLDVSGCTALETLNCSRSDLTSLDVSKNKVLQNLDCRECNLIALEWDGYSAEKYGCAQGNRAAGILDAKSNRFDLSNLSGFKLERAYNWKGGKVVDGHYLEYDSAVVTYEYKVNDNADCGETFCLKTKSNEVNLDRLSIAGLDFWQSRVFWRELEYELRYDSVFDFNYLYLYSVENIVFTATTSHRFAQIVSGLGEHPLKVGETRIEIKVMAEDSSQRTYTLVFHRPEGLVRSLVVSAGILEPAFSPDIYDYRLTVPYETDSLEVFAEARDESATVSGVGKYGLEVGNNFIRINVTTEKNDRRLYSLTVRRKELVLSSDAALQSLMVSAGTLEPVFSSDVYDYNVEVPYETDSLEVGAVVRHDSAKVSGAGGYDLEVGANRIRIVVTAEDGSQQTYTLTVRRKELVLSSDAALQSLMVSDGTLEPAFSSETYYYNVEVPYETDSLEVNAVARHDNATVSGTGKYGLQVGGNNISIVVTAENGERQVYTLSVRRKERVLSSDATLRALSVSVGTLRPSFSPTTFNYRVEVPNDIKSMDVIAEANDSNANVSGTNRHDLAVGDNHIEIIVTAEDGTQRTYALVVYREKPKDPTAVESVAGLSDVRVYAQDGAIHLSKSIGELAVYTASGLCVYSGQAVVIPVAQPGLYIVRRVADGYSWKVVVR